MLLPILLSFTLVLSRLGDEINLSRNTRSSKTCQWVVDAWPVDYLLGTITPPTESPTIAPSNSPSQSPTPGPTANGGINDNQNNHPNNQIIDSQSKSSSATAAIVAALSGVTSIPRPTNECIYYDENIVDFEIPVFGEVALMYKCLTETTIERKIWYDKIVCNGPPDETTILDTQNAKGFFLFNCAANVEQCGTAHITFAEATTSSPTPSPSSSPTKPTVNNGGNQPQSGNSNVFSDIEKFDNSIWECSNTLGVKPNGQNIKLNVASGVCLEVTFVWSMLEQYFHGAIKDDPYFGELIDNKTWSEIKNFTQNNKDQIDEFMLTYFPQIPFVFSNLTTFHNIDTLTFVDIANIAKQILGYFDDIDHLLTIIETSPLVNQTIPANLRSAIKTAWSVVTGYVKFRCYKDSNSFVIGLFNDALCSDTDENVIKLHDVKLVFGMQKNTCFINDALYVSDITCSGLNVGGTIPQYLSASVGYTYNIFISLIFVCVLMFFV